MKVGPLDETWARRKVLLDDAETLERAARILRLRSRKPGSILLAAFCNVLNGEARRIRVQAGQ